MCMRAQIRKLNCARAYLAQRREPKNSCRKTYTIGLLFVTIINVVVVITIIIIIIIIIISMISISISESISIIIFITICCGTRHS